MMSWARKVTYLERWNSHLIFKANIFVPFVVDCFPGSTANPDSIKVSKQAHFHTSIHKRTQYSQTISMAQTMYTGRLVARRTPDLYGRYGWAAYQTQKRTESSQQDGVQAIQDEQPTPRKRRRRKTDPWTPRRKRTVSKMKQEEPVSVYKALSDEE